MTAWIPAEATFHPPWLVDSKPQIDPVCIPGRHKTPAAGHQPAYANDFIVSKHELRFVVANYAMGGMDGDREEGFTTVRRSQR